jgi:integrase
MTRSEVDALLARLGGVWRLMASLLYGSGLRLLECASLRVKDVDFGGRATAGATRQRLEGSRNNSTEELGRASGGSAEKRAHVS